MEVQNDAWVDHPSVTELDDLAKVPSLPKTSSKLDSEQSIFKKSWNIINSFFDPIPCGDVRALKIVKTISKKNVKSRPLKKQYSFDCFNAQFYQSFIPISHPFSAFQQTANSLYAKPKRPRSKGIVARAEDELDQVTTTLRKDKVPSEPNLIDFDSPVDLSITAKDENNNIILPDSSFPFFESTEMPLSDPIEEKLLQTDLLADGQFGEREMKKKVDEVQSTQDMLDEEDKESTISDFYNPEFPQDINDATVMLYKSDILINTAPITGEYPTKGTSQEEFQIEGESDDESISTKSSDFSNMDDSNLNYPREEISNMKFPEFSDISDVEEDSVPKETTCKPLQQEIIPTFVNSEPPPFPSNNSVAIIESVQALESEVHLFEEKQIPDNNKIDYSDILNNESCSDEAVSSEDEEEEEEEIPESIMKPIFAQEQVQSQAPPILQIQQISPLVTPSASSAEVSNSSTFVKLVHSNPRIGLTKAAILNTASSPFSTPLASPSTSYTNTNQLYSRYNGFNSNPSSMDIKGNCSRVSSVQGSNANLEHGELGFPKEKAFFNTELKPRVVRPTSARTTPNNSRIPGRIRTTPLKNQISETTNTRFNARPSPSFTTPRVQISKSRMSNVNISVLPIPSGFSTPPNASPSSSFCNTRHLTIIPTTPSKVNQYQVAPVVSNSSARSMPYPKRYQSLPSTAANATAPRRASTRVAKPQSANAAIGKESKSYAQMCEEKKLYALKQETLALERKQKAQSLSRACSRNPSKTGGDF